MLPDMAYARPDAAGTVVMQGPELSSRYFGICDGGATECLYGCLCPWCMAAQLKTELDGRPCGLCDCLCSSFPHNNIALRRQLRRKYGLELSVSTENCGCCACTGTYAQDCWCVRATALPALYIFSGVLSEHPTGAAWSICSVSRRPENTVVTLGVGWN